MQTPHRWIRARHRHDRRRLLARDEGAVLASLDAHRQLRGPYTAGGTLLRMLVPPALRQWPDLIAAHAGHIAAAAPELAGVVGVAASPGEAAGGRTGGGPRLAPGLTDFLHELVRRLDDGPRWLLVDNVHEADPTDRELLAVLLRHADPALLRLRLATASAEFADPPGALAEPLAPALASRADAVDGRPTALPPLPPGDPVCWYLADHCTDDDPRLVEAYERLSPDARAARHDARAAALEAMGEPSLLLGAVPFHRERGGDPAGAGADALHGALRVCLERGFHHAAVEFAARGRAAVAGDRDPARRAAFAVSGARALAALGRHEEALAAAEEAVAAEPGRAGHHVARGDVLRGAGRHAEAVPAYERALRIAPAHAGAVFGRGEARLALGDETGALEDFDDAAALDPARAEAHARRARLRYESADVKGAWRAVRAGLEAAPGDPGLLCLRGKLLAPGYPRASFAQLTELVTQHPDFAPGWAARGRVARRLGEVTAAVADLDRALALADDPEVRYDRAMACLRAGRREEALADLRTALRTSRDPSTRLRIAACLRSLGQGALPAETL
ncbi:hypothetical protein GCM10027168_70280 [Streptomyces capparidis]